MKKTIEFTESWLGGEPRVTINPAKNDPNMVVIKLLGSHRRRGSWRLEQSNQSDTTSKKTVYVNKNDLVSIMREAEALAISAGKKCWVWDACKSGAAKLYQETQVATEKTEQAPFFDDEINF